jgi:hypothetical protein
MPKSMIVEDVLCDLELFFKLKDVEHTEMEADLPVESIIAPVQHLSEYGDLDSLGAVSKELRHSLVFVSTESSEAGIAIEAALKER